MKIGILTFHRAHNYGAVLQAFALYKTLEKLGNNVEIVDYTPVSILRSHDIWGTSHFKKKKLKGKIKYLVFLLFHLDVKIKRYSVFSNFINNRLPLSSKTDLTKDCYDVLFFGSDQIWNPYITQGFDSIYLGNILKDGKKLVSYAASAETAIDSESANLAYNNIVSNFDWISVREIGLQKYIQKFTNKIIFKVLDPVFLLSKEEWSRLALCNKQYAPYLLIYQVRTDDRIYKMAQDLAQREGVGIVEITSKMMKRKKGRLQDISPFEFIGYIKNARYILTTSFHGTAFSIIFQKEFYTVLFGGEGDLRSLELLNSFGLMRQTVDIGDEIKTNVVDYEMVTSLLLEEKEKSMEYIKTTLQ